MLLLLLAVALCCNAIFLIQQPLELAARPSTSSKSPSPKRLINPSSSPLRRKYFEDIVNEHEQWHISRPSIELVSTTFVEKNYVYAVQPQKNIVVKQIISFEEPLRRGHPSKAYGEDINGGIHSDQDDKKLENIRRKLFEHLEIVRDNIPATLPLFFGLIPPKPWRPWRFFRPLPKFKRHKRSMFGQPTRVRSFRLKKLLLPNKKKAIRWTDPEPPQIVFLRNLTETGAFFGPKLTRESKYRNVEAVRLWKELENTRYLWQYYDRLQLLAQYQFSKMTGWFLPKFERTLVFSLRIPPPKVTFVNVLHWDTTLLTPRHFKVFQFKDLNADDEADASMESNDIEDNNEAAVVDGEIDEDNRNDEEAFSELEDKEHNGNSIFRFDSLSATYGSFNDEAYGSSKRNKREPPIPKSSEEWLVNPQDVEYVSEVNDVSSRNFKRPRRMPKWLGYETLPKSAMAYYEYPMDKSASGNVVLSTISEEMDPPRLLRTRRAATYGDQQPSPRAFWTNQSVEAFSLTNGVPQPPRIPRLPITTHQLFQQYGVPFVRVSPPDSVTLLGPPKLLSPAKPRDPKPSHFGSGKPSKKVTINLGVPVYIRARPINNDSHSIVEQSKNISKPHGTNSKRSKRSLIRNPIFESVFNSADNSRPLAQKVFEGGRQRSLCPTQSNDYCQFQPIQGASEYLKKMMQQWKLEYVHQAFPTEEPFKTYGVPGQMVVDKTLALPRLSKKQLFTKPKIKINYEVPVYLRPASSAAGNVGTSTIGHWKALYNDLLLPVVKPSNLFKGEQYVNPSLPQYQHVPTSFTTTNFPGLDKVKLVPNHVPNVGKHIQFKRPNEIASTAQLHIPKPDNLKQFNKFDNVPTLPASVPVFQVPKEGRKDYFNLKTTDVNHHKEANPKVLPVFLEVPRKEVPGFFQKRTKVFTYLKSLHVPKEDTAKLFSIDARSGLASDPTQQTNRVPEKDKHIQFKNPNKIPTIPVHVPNEDSLKQINQFGNELTRVLYQVNGVPTLSASVPLLQVPKDSRKDYFNTKASDVIHRQKEANTKVASVFLKVPRNEVPAVFQNGTNFFFNLKGDEVQSLNVPKVNTDAKLFNIDAGSGLASDLTQQSLPGLANRVPEKDRHFQFKNPNKIPTIPSHVPKEESDVDNPSGKVATVFLEAPRNKVPGDFQKITTNFTLKADEEQSLNVSKDNTVKLFSKDAGSGLASDPTQPSNPGLANQVPEKDKHIQLKHPNKIPSVVVPAIALHVPREDRNEYFNTKAEVASVFLDVPRNGVPDVFHKSALKRGEVQSLKVPKQNTAQRFSDKSESGLATPPKPQSLPKADSMTFFSWSNTSRAKSVVGFEKIEKNKVENNFPKALEDNIKYNAQFTLGKLGNIVANDRDLVNPGINGVVVANAFKTLKFAKSENVTPTAFTGKGANEKKVKELVTEAMLLPNSSKIFEFAEGEAGSSGRLGNNVNAEGKGTMVKELAGKIVPDASNGYQFVQSVADVSDSSGFEVNEGVKFKFQRIPGILGNHVDGGTEQKAKANTNVSKKYEFVESVADLSNIDVSNSSSGFQINEGVKFKFQLIPGKSGNRVEDSGTAQKVKADVLTASKNYHQFGEGEAESSGSNNDEGEGDEGDEEGHKANNNASNKKSYEFVKSVADLSKIIDVSNSSAGFQVNEGVKFRFQLIPGGRFGHNVDHAGTETNPMSENNPLAGGLNSKQSSAEKAGNALNASASGGRIKVSDLATDDLPPNPIRLQSTLVSQNPATRPIKNLVIATLKNRTRKLIGRPLPNAAKEHVFSHNATTSLEENLGSATKNTSLNNRFKGHNDELDSGKRPNNRQKNIVAEFLKNRSVATKSRDSEVNNERSDIPIEEDVVGNSTSLGKFRNNTLVTSRKYVTRAYNLRNTTSIIRNRSSIGSKIVNNNAPGNNAPDVGDDQVDGSGRLKNKVLVKVIKRLPIGDRKNTSGQMN